MRHEGIDVYIIGPIGIEAGIIVNVLVADSDTCRSMLIAHLKFSAPASAGLHHLALEPGAPSCLTPRVGCWRTWNPVVSPLTLMMFASISSSRSFLFCEQVVPRMHAAHAAGEMTLGFPSGR